MKSGVIGLLGLGSLGHWFVDSVSGDDSNSGHDEAEAFETLGQLLASDVQAGDIISLARGSTWREELTGLPSHVQVRAYGAGAKPMIDGSDVALNASFTKTDGRTNIYEISWGHDFDAGGGKTAHRAWEDGTRMRRAATQAAADSNLAAALDTLDAMPGAFVSQTPTSGGPDVIYIHPAGSTDPTSDGKVYEFSKRAWALQLYDHRLHASVYSVHTRRNAHADGSLVVDGLISDCYAEDGRVHNVYIRGVAEDCIAELMEPQDTPGGSTMFVSHTSSTSPWSNHKDVVYRRCQALAEADALAPGGSTHAMTTLGFYGHTSGAPEHFWGAAYYEECHAENVLTAYGFANVERCIYYKCTTENARFSFVPFTTELVAVLGGRHMTAENSAHLLGYENDFEVPPSIVMRGVRWAGTGANNFPIRINIALTTLEMSRCTIAGPDAGGINWFQDGAFSVLESIIHGAGLRVGQTGESLPTYAADNNLYWFWDGNQYFGANFQTENSPPNDFIGLAAWQTEMGQDASSVVGDPLFVGDPMAGDFTVESGSPANTLGAGADYEGEDNDAVLQAYLTQYTAGLST